MDVWSIVWLGSAIIGIVLVIVSTYLDYRRKGIFTFGDLFTTFLLMAGCCIPVVGTIAVVALIEHLNTRLRFSNIVIFRKGNR